jgi:CRISPR-associated protein Csb2
MPPGTVWVSYGAGDPAFSDGRSAELVRTDLTAIRFAVLGKPVAMRAANGVLLADDVHYRAGQVMTKAGIPDERRQGIMGTGGARSEHRHAHWIPVPALAERGAPVTSMLVWVPDGLQPEELRALLANDLRTVSGKRGGADGYEIRGFPELELLFQAAGSVEQVIPQLCKPSRRWRSLTPYLPVRHRKRESVDEFIAADVRAELNYRLGGTREVTVTWIETGTRILDHWASEFRRRRTKERLTDRRASRPGLGLRLEFAEPVGGPMVLGQLSHFGFGLFEPEDC